MLLIHIILHYGSVSFFNLVKKKSIFVSNNLSIIQSQILPALSNMFAKQEQDRFGSGGMNSLRMLALLGASVSGLLSCATVAYSDEAEHGLACPNYPWPHNGILSSYDHAS